MPIGRTTSQKNVEAGMSQLDEMKDSIAVAEFAGLRYVNDASKN